MCVACVYTAEYCNQSQRCVFWHLVNHTHYLISQSLKIAASERPNNATIVRKCSNLAVFFLYYLLLIKTFAFSLCFLLRVITLVMGELTLLWWYLARTKEFTQGLV